MYVTYVYKEEYALELNMEPMNTIQVYGDRPVHWSGNFVCFVVQDPALYGEDSEILAINSDCLIHYFNHKEQ